MHKVEDKPLPKYLERSARVVPGGAGEGELDAELGPPLRQVGVGQGLLEITRSTSPAYVALALHVKNLKSERGKGMK